MFINQQILLLQMMSQAQGQHRDLIQSIEGLPSSQGPSPLDQDLLLLKATSLATMTCLSDCLHILQLQQVARQKVPLSGEFLFFIFICVLILVVFFIMLTVTVDMFTSLHSMSHLHYLCACPVKNG